MASVCQFWTLREKQPGCCQTPFHLSRCDQNWSVWSSTSGQVKCENRIELCTFVTEIRALLSRQMSKIQPETEARPSNFQKVPRALVLPSWLRWCPTSAIRTVWSKHMDPDYLQVGRVFSRRLRSYSQKSQGSISRSRPLDLYIYIYIYIETCKFSDGVDVASEHACQWESFFGSFLALSCTVAVWKIQDGRHWLLLKMFFDRKRGEIWVWLADCCNKSCRAN